MPDFYFDNICILYVMLLDAGSITGAEKVWKKKVHLLYSKALLTVICFCCLVQICTDVSPQVIKHFDSKKRHFIVMLKLIHPSDQSVMKEPACVIGYAIWISIGCHAFLSYPLMTGCICTAHAICDMPSHTFDEENKVWGILYSDRWGNAISTITNHMFRVFHSDL